MGTEATEHIVRTIPTASDLARAAPAPCRGLRGRWLRATRRWLLVLGQALVLLVIASVAQARDIVHIVAKGQTLGSIAQRYGTTVRAIQTDNRLPDDRQLYPGQKLRITGVAEKRSGDAADEDDDDPPCEPRAPGGAGTRGPGQADPYARKPARPGFLSMIRYGEVFRGPLLGADGKVMPQAHARISHLMRDLRANKQLPIDPRLLRLVAEVSDHFGGRTVVVVSGYREYTPRQFARRSRHNVGRAIDMRIVGVPNDVLRDFCLTLPGVGVGYYPYSTFVHLDNRGYHSAWVDYSAPGEAPRYTCRPSASPSARSSGARRPSTSSGHSL
jgi:LysM repeat protein